jgi:hypothetical protein
MIERLQRLGKKRPQRARLSPATVKNNGVWAFTKGANTLNVQPIK